MKKLVVILVPMLAAVFLGACSHKFAGDSLDLGFYQWNMWVEDQAVTGFEEGPEGKVKGIPSCGWEEFHRGKGKLVRIPALSREHFPEAGEGAVLWYHCRFTLPDLWEHRPITFRFEGLSHSVGVYLNEKLLELERTGAMSYEVEVSGSIFYTLDNHLAIRITGEGPGPRGITGPVMVVSTPPQSGH